MESAENKLLIAAAKTIISWSKECLRACIGERPETNVTNIPLIVAPYRDSRIQPGQGRDPLGK